MRGSAQPVPGRPVPAALRASWQGPFGPVHPDQEGALPLVGSPAPEGLPSDTSRPRVRPFAIRAQGALRPEAPAVREVFSPFLDPPRAHLRMER